MWSKFIVTFILFCLLKQNETVSNNGKYVICYHGTWSTYRQSIGKYDVTNIDPFLCTHLMYAFFGIEESGDIRIIDPYLDLEDNFGRGNIKKFNALKLKNPTLKTLAAIGGWNEGSKNFSIVANDEQKRKRFVQSVVKFIQRHGFDGIDLDWEYPGQRHSLKNVNDRENYITLLRELREGLEPFSYLLTAAVGSAEFSASISYNIPEVVKYLDFINVMAYDLHGFWDDTIGINAPLYPGLMDTTPKSKQLNVDAIMKYWVTKGAPYNKLVLGIPFYGRSFTLADPSKNTPGSPHLGRGIAGQYSVEPGVIGYNELCEKMQQEEWIVQWESNQMVPYAYRNNQWIGFESPDSISLKAKYVMANDYAGIMIWSLESDDFRGICHDVKYPLLNIINNILSGQSETVVPEEITSNVILTSPTTTVTAISIQKYPTTIVDITVPYPSFECTTESGFIRDPYDCGRFYKCANGYTYRFSCPKNLRFDINLKTCNYPQLVKCD